MVVVFGQIAEVARQRAVEQQPGLSEKQCFKLEYVVAVFGCGEQRNVESPLFERFAVYAEAEVACYGYEAHAVPVAVTAVKVSEYAVCLFFQPFYVQGGKPRADFYAVEPGGVPVTGRIFLLDQQLRVVFLDVLRNLHYKLRQCAAVHVFHLGVGHGNHVQDDVPVFRVLVMAVAVPVAAFGVHFNVAGKLHSVQFDGTVYEIGSGVGVVKPGVYDFQGLPVGGVQFANGKQLVLPCVM